jgi:hypothetical protein
MLKFLTIAIIVISVIGVTATTSFAKFIREDFEITGLGLKDGNPYIQVQGQAGQSFPVECQDECFYAYIFETDKGKYAILVQSNLNDPPKASYGVAEIKAATIKENEKYDFSLLSEQSADYKFSGHTAEFVSKNLDINNVSHVYTMYLDAGCDPTCMQGKIWSSK